MDDLTLVDAHTPAPGTVTARMFAPAIGVGEDVVNANSSGCLAAHLLAVHGNGRVDVHQGAAAGRPSLVRATADGNSVRVGGVAAIRLFEGFGVPACEYRGKGSNVDATIPLRE